MIEKELPSGRQLDEEFSRTETALRGFSPALSDIILELGVPEHYARQASEKANCMASFEYQAIECAVRPKTAKERAEAMLKYNPDAILLLHPDLHIQQTNVTFHTLFACEPHVYHDCSLYDLIDEADIAHVNAIIQLASAKQTGEQVEIHCRRKDDTHFDAELSISPITVGAETTGWVCTLRDITKRKRTDADLLQALKKDEAANDRKLRFIAMASHELRAPLTSMLMITDTLRIYRHKLAEPQIDLRLGQIKTQIMALAALIEDTLQLAQLQVHRIKFNPVECSLDTLCRNILDEFQSQNVITPQFIYTCDTQLCKAQLDETLMRRIITNLVSNAIKYSPASKPILVSLSCNSEMLSLTVQDEGIGIPAAEIDHIFEPFHRATNVDSIIGTGLGLAIVKDAVELHSGTITVVSELGVGTIFTVHIPIMPCAGKA